MNILRMLVVIELMQKVEEHEGAMNDHYKKGQTIDAEIHFQITQGILSRVSDQDYQRFKQYL